MIKLNHIINEDKRLYRGDCRTILGQDDLFNDATQMSGAIENSDKIDYHTFGNEANLTGAPRMFKLRLRRNTDKFDFGKYKDLVWAYDTETDIHYFFL